MHIFFTAFPAWGTFLFFANLNTNLIPNTSGHIRPFCIFAARLAKERPDIALSLVLSPTYLQNAEDEISSELRDDAPEGVRSRIRYFQVCIILLYVLTLLCQGLLELCRFFSRPI